MSNNFLSWKAKYDAQKERKGPFFTVSSVPIDPLYAPGHTADIDYERDLGNPGEYPYTRGVQPNMYRGRLWTMRMFAGFATATETNERYKYLLNQGQTGLSVAFDMPTIMGYDSDHPRAYGEVGRVGVAIDSLQDMETLFQDIPLDKVSTSMTINAPASILWAMYIVAAEKQGVPANKLTGTIQNDIFKFAKDNVPKWNSISISGYHIREAGSTALQELAFTLVDGFAYVKAGIKAGLDVDDFAPRLSFFFNSHTDFFEEIAKLRAARRIWARHMKEKYGAKNEKSLLLRFHTQTAGCSLTGPQMENNIVRTAYQAMAAVLGGTQSLHTNSMDEVLALPSEKSVQIALRTQQVLAYETGVTNTIDPLAGSYFVETLTNQMEEGAEEYFRKIDEFGGVLGAIRENFFQQEIADAAYRYQKEIESKDRIIVGINGFVNEKKDDKMDLLKIDPEVERSQVSKLTALKQSRDNIRVQTTLADLKAAAQGSDNMIPKIMDAVRAYATEGEMIAVLKEVFGEYREQAVF